MSICVYHFITGGRNNAEGKNINVPSTSFFTGLEFVDL